MPRKPLKPCRFPGCPELTDEQYCEKHRKTARRQYDKYERSEDIHLKYGFRWHKIRQRYAKAHPLCELCLKEGRYTPVEEVHHILPIAKGGTHDESNLMSLCRSCHNKIHIEMGDRQRRQKEKLLSLFVFGRGISISTTFFCRNGADSRAKKLKIKGGIKPTGQGSCPGCPP